MSDSGGADRKVPRDGSSFLTCGCRVFGTCRSTAPQLLIPPALTGPTEEEEKNDPSRATGAVLNRPRHDCLPVPNIRKNHGKTYMPVD